MGTLVTRRRTLRTGLAAAAAIAIPSAKAQQEIVLRIGAGRA